ncbi:efflux RND transporter periplasmic adaptor subunit [Planctomycetaceae bacterium SH139]
MLLTVNLHQYRWATALALLLVACSAQALIAQPPGSVSDGVVFAEEAQVTFINDVRVPSQVEGLLKEILVEEGAVVEKGQALALLDDRDSVLTVKLKIAEEKEARLNAENDINRQYAVRSQELSSEKATAYAELFQQKLMAKWEARSAQLEAYRDQLQIDLADINKDIALAQFGAKSVEREMAEMAVDKRRIIAPFSGFVEQRIGQLGEWVQPGSPIVKLVQMDRLRAEGYLNYEVANSVTEGMPAILEFTVRGQPIERINGKVGFVGYAIDLSERRRVWVEFENQRIGDDWLIKPGMKLNLKIDTNR